MQKGRRVEPIRQQRQAIALQLRVFNRSLGLHLAGNNMIMMPAFRERVPVRAMKSLKLCACRFTFNVHTACMHAVVMVGRLPPKDDRGYCLTEKLIYWGGVGAALNRLKKHE
jgi:hypothetical protein